MMSKKDPFLSLPVSRVGLSTRLNQIAQPNLRPATPATYVSSSLNPNKARSATPVATLAGLKLVSQEDLQRFEELPIVKDIRQFETTLAAVAAAVSSFKDEEVVPAVHKLIDINENISKAVGDLETHQQLSLEIAKLKQENDELDNHLKETLRKLISIRASLRLVPGTSTHNISTTAQDLHGLDIPTLLDYSMKLAKFSKAPATVQSQMVHPNNYIWPAEDALRRGMLAMASLKPDELIRAELGAEEEEAVDADGLMEVDTEQLNQVAGIDENVMEEKPPASSPKPHTEKFSKPKQPAVASLDLDLFDPEDDDSD